MLSMITTWALLQKTLGAKNMPSVASDRTHSRYVLSKKAAAAMEAGRFADEITPVSVPQGKKTTTLGKYRRTTTFRDATGKTSATETGLSSGGGKRHRRKCLFH